VSVLITKDVFSSWTAACFTWKNILNPKLSIFLRFWLQNGHSRSYIV
jgi:hypothetical protein